MFGGSQVQKILRSKDALRIVPYFVLPCIIKNSGKMENPLDRIVRKDIIESNI